MRVASLLLLFCSPLAADEIMIAGRNGEMLFDMSTINHSPDRLADDGHPFGEADIAISDGASPVLAYVTRDRSGSPAVTRLAVVAAYLGRQPYLKTFVELGPFSGRSDW